jgi:hypothetical protein
MTYGITLYIQWVDELIDLMTSLWDIDLVKQTERSEKVIRGG